MVTKLRFLLQRPQHHIVEPHIDLHLAGGRGELAQRQFTGEHLVEDDAQRVDVRPVVHALGMLDLFRRHIVRRAHDLPHAGQMEVLRLAAQDFGQAEVGDLCAALLVQQHVLRLDVAVHDAFVVRILEGLANLGDDLQRLGRGEFAGPFNLPQVRAIHILHEEVVQTGEWLRVEG